MPVLSILGQVALMGGPGVAKSLGGVESEDSRLITLAHEAADSVGVPRPRVFEVPSREPNAFAASGLSGTRDATVAVTKGLREILTEVELGAVLAHEMGHLRHRDVARNLHVAAATAGLGGIYQTGRWLLDSSTRSRRSTKRKDEDKGDGGAGLGLALMAGGAATQAAAHLLRMMASRNAELLADHAAAEAYGAASLISALQKIDAHAARRPADLRHGATGKAYAHLMISDGPSARPASATGWASPATQHGKAHGLSGVLSKVGDALRTHPSLDKRVAALESAVATGAVPARKSARGWW